MNWKSIVLLSMLVPTTAAAQDPLTRAYTADECPSCAEWNEPRPPVHVFGNVYHVGTGGLGSVLIASPEGHVLIDGGLPNSVPLILENIRALGFDPDDVVLILNSHPHYDHAGGIAAMQQETGARVAASPDAAEALESGRVGDQDPQYGIALPMPPVRDVEVIRDGQTLRVGSIAVTAHFTGGHSPGGTTWSWRACEGERCLDFVYADSQTPVSRDGFRYTDHPRAVADFRRGFDLLENMPCDILLAPHPWATSLWEKIGNGREALVDPEACRRLAANGRERLRERLEREKS